MTSLRELIERSFCVRGYDKILIRKFVIFDEWFLCPLIPELSLARALYGLNPGARAPRFNPYVERSEGRVQRLD